jgi:phospholipid/cholesterol/gamma-HCH transport system permease protein
VAWRAGQNSYPLVNGKVFSIAHGIAIAASLWQKSEMIRHIGSKSLDIVGGIGDFGLFLVRTFASLPRSRKILRRFVRALHEQGTVCLPVVLIVGVFTGLVLGLQGYHVLSRFGSEGLLGTMVSLSLVREMAPVLAALMLIGQAGSAFAAELGIQRNSDQISALETMGVDSLGYLVAPRLLAALFVYPAQAALFVVVGLWGGSVSGSMLLGVDAGVYWSTVNHAIEFRDLRECFSKAAVFGLLSTAICAYQGFHAGMNHKSAGARAVSAATTRAVVFSSIMVLVADYLISSFFV